KLNDQEFKLEDANKVVDPRKYCTFRIHFLPPNFNTQLLHNFFNVLKIDGLKIEDISEETYKDSTIKNEVKRVKIFFPKNADPIIQSLSGPTVIYGLKCVFTIAGQKLKCHFCNEDGHNIAKCPLKQSICGKCQLKGHLIQKCSLAEKLKSLERSKIDYSDLYINETEPKTNIESYNAAPKTPEFSENWNMEQKSRHSSASSDTSLNTPVLDNFVRQKPSEDQSQITNQNKSISKTNLTPVFTKNRPKRQSESESKNKPKKQLTNREEEEDAFESFFPMTQLRIRIRTRSKIDTKIDELESPDILLLNEIKIDSTQSNFYLDFINYQSIVKPRDKRGGGVAILIKNGIEFSIDSSFDNFSLELLKSASGPDLIHNLMLKNLPESTLYDILKLFNLSLTTRQIPNNWKKAQVSMIPKKVPPTQDPSKYRPISLTSCLGKLLERIIYTRLYSYIEKNFSLIQEQSGFRKHRRTADNLFFLIQKITESFNRKKKYVVFFLIYQKHLTKSGMMDLCTK
ncbi:unnamed protein product, partial [Brachionus calyciflorus]